jgi:hypothetical protein
LRSTARLTRYTDLYTSSFWGTESDSFERWLNEEIEQPAVEPLAKVRADVPLVADDWKRLARYAAALDVRTPASYLEQKDRWVREVPITLKQTMTNLESRLRRAIKRGEVPTKPPATSEAFPIKVTLGPAEAGKVPVRAEVVMGREMWLWSQRHLLTNTAEVLAKHQWVVLKPHPGSAWFTSDHPMLRLNFYSPERYDFGGGWGNKGTELILPLSPEHLMYTKIGSKWKGATVLSPEHTLQFQRFVSERAHRWIIASGKPMRAEMFRPRRVDLDAFRSEKHAWKLWHPRNREVELGPASDI